jgi:hypothetical protein
MESAFGRGNWYQAKKMNDFSMKILANTLNITHQVLLFFYLYTFYKDENTVTLIWSTYWKKPPSPSKDNGTK